MHQQIRPVPKKETGSGGWIPPDPHSPSSRGSRGVPGKDHWWGHCSVQLQTPGHVQEGLCKCAHRNDRFRRTDRYLLPEHLLQGCYSSKVRGMELYVLSWKRIIHWLSVLGNFALRFTVQYWALYESFHSTTCFIHIIR